MAQVNSVMTARPAACRTDTPVAVVAQLMIDHDCGEIPIVDGAGHPVGVITDRDIVVRLIASGRDIRDALASHAMSQPVHTVAENDELRDCVCLMESERIRRVPVVDSQGRLTGIVSLADIARSDKDAATVEVVKEVSRPGAS